MWRVFFYNCPARDCKSLLKWSCLDYSKGPLPRYGLYEAPSDYKYWKSRRQFSHNSLGNSHVTCITSALVFLAQSPLAVRKVSWNCMAMTIWIHRVVQLGCDTCGFVVGCDNWCSPSNYLPSTGMWCDGSSSHVDSFLSSEPRYKSGINSFMVFLLEIAMFCKFICQLLPWVRLPLEICPPLAPMLFKYRLGGDLCHHKYFHGWSVNVKKPKKLSDIFSLVASQVLGWFFATSPNLNHHLVRYIYIDVHFPVINLSIFQLPQLYHLSRCGISKTLPLHQLPCMPQVPVV